MIGLRNPRQKLLGDRGRGEGSEKLIVTYSGILSHNFGGLKFFMVGVFTLRKWANSLNQGSPLPPNPVRQHTIAIVAHQRNVGDCLV